MSRDITKLELDLLYSSSAVTRSFKRGRFSPTCGGGLDGGAVGGVAGGDRRVTRRYSRVKSLPTELQVSIQMSALENIVDKSPSLKAAARDSEYDTDGSMPPLDPVDLSFSSESDRYIALTDPAVPLQL